MTHTLVPVQFGYTAPKAITFGNPLQQGGYATRVADKRRNYVEQT